MWQQNYTPIGGNLLASALVAALPIFTILILLGILRRPAWLAAVSAVIVALLVALLAYQMPPMLAVSATLFGAAFGLFPIWWVVFAAIFLFRIVEETGRFEVIKNSVVQLTNDQRLQVLLIGFTFGAFMEGAAGFGAPVAVAAAMLAAHPAAAEDHRFEADPVATVHENFVACEVLSQLQRVMENPRFLLAGECVPLRAGERVRVYASRGPHACIYPHDTIAPCKWTH